jgi:hypothetical protein
MRGNLVRMVGALVLIATFAAVAAPGSGTGRYRYKWKDEQGTLQYTDSIPSEAAKNGYEVVNEQGVIVKRVERAKTPEELKIAQEQAIHAEEAKRLVEQQIRSDQQMLAAYPNEQELTKSQNAQLELLVQNIQSAKTGIVSQEKSLTDLLAHAAELERSGKVVSAKLTQQISDLRMSVENGKQMVARMEREKAEASKKTDAELKHYRELIAKSKASN